MAAATNRVIVYGGKGGLGTVIVSHFKSKGWWICSIDINGNDQADNNVLVNPNDSWKDQEVSVSKAVADMLVEQKVDAIINMAGEFKIVILHIVGELPALCGPAVPRTISAHLKKSKKKDGKQHIHFSEMMRLLFL